MIATRTAVLRLIGALLCCAVLIGLTADPAAEVLTVDPAALSFLFGLVLGPIAYIWAFYGRNWRL